MPNWCENVLVITLPKDHPLVKDFDLIINKKPDSEFGLLNLFHPMPAHQPDVKKANPFFATGGLGSKEQKLYGRNNWYDWSIENWGTKWDVFSSDIHGSVIKNVNSFTYEFVFDTAWAPPIQALLKSGLDFELYYYESGMCFAGYASKDEDHYIKFTDDVFKNTFSNKDAYRSHLIKTIRDMGIPSSFFNYFDVDYLFYPEFHDEEGDDHVN